MTDLIKKLFRRFHRLIAYGIVGVINTVADYIVFYLLYRLAGIPIGISQVLGFLSGTVVSFLLNSNVTFREGKGRTKGQFFQYIGIDIVLALLSGWFMKTAEGWGVPVLPLKVAVTVGVALIHYVIYKYCVFRIKKEDEG